MRHKNQQKYIKSIFCENILTKMGFSIIILLFAGVAQSVVQLIRNQQVVCSSHITSSIGVASKRMQRLFFIRLILRW